MNTQTEATQPPTTLAELNELSDQAEALTPSAYPPGRVMVDSVNPDAIQRAIQSGAIKPDLVAGYPDFGWAPEDFQLFQRHNYNTVRITQRNPGDWRLCAVGDYETGALTALGLRTYIVARAAFRPHTQTAYASFSNLARVGSILSGIPFYWVWVAWWPDYPTNAEIAEIRAQLRPGARLAGVQYRNKQALDIDLSLILDADWTPAKRDRN